MSELKERPILFNSKMVRAILDGRKTQTRRIMKPQPAFDVLGDPGCWYPSYFKKNCMHYGNPKHFQNGVVKDFSPFGQPGDRLWVRETWGWFTPVWDGIEWVPDRPFREVYEKKFGQGYVDGNLIWAADGSFAWADEDSMEERSAWKPSIHMPRWASRITLEIKSVRVERLQDISDVDCNAEGRPNDYWRDHKQWFEDVWTMTGGDWKQNPWVWVIEFERVK